jgi:hypothetical protein
MEPFRILHQDLSLEESVRNDQVRERIARLHRTLIANLKSSQA